MRSKPEQGYLKSMQMCWNQSDVLFSRLSKLPKGKKRNTLRCKYPVSRFNSNWLEVFFSACFPVGLAQVNIGTYLMGATHAILSCY